MTEFTLERAGLSVGRGLLGTVTPRLRVVQVVVSPGGFAIECYYDGIASDEERELMSAMEGEVLADFFDEVGVELRIMRLDAPTPVPTYEVGVGWRVFARYEGFEE